MGLIPYWLYAITTQLYTEFSCRTAYIPYHCGSFAQLASISWDIFGYYHFAAFSVFHQTVENIWNSAGLAVNKNPLVTVPILLRNVCKDRTCHFFSLQLKKWLNTGLLKSSQSVPRPWGPLM